MTEIVTLSDSSGAQARVHTGFGFNCFSFAAVAGGEARETLWSAPGFEHNKSGASGSGIPLLFPFPGRIRGVSFHWQGVDYPLEAGDGRGNAIHGFVHQRGWRVIDQTPDSVQGEFHASVDDPALLKRWPSDFRIRARYSLQAGALALEVEMENPADSPLPCGFGAHPYFRLPLGDASVADECRVQLPVSSEWELNGMLPTGRLLQLANAKAFAEGLRFGEMSFDNVFTGLKFSGDTCVSRIVDRAAGRVLTLGFDRAFRECVVYNPPHRQAVCIEPYTCLPGVFSLPDKSIDGGMKVLVPGESFTAAMTIRLDLLKS